MYYFAFPPFKKQYIFPSNVKNNSVLKSLYTPYSIHTKILWWIWIQFSIGRFFKVHGGEDKKVLSNVLEILPKTYEFAINKGTKGLEQKISLLAYKNQDDSYVFIKVGSTLITKILLKNEAMILTKLYGKSFCPKLIDFNENDNSSYLKTEVIQGSKIESTILSDEIINLIIQVNNQSIDSVGEDDSSLKQSFGHGDFCPWNVMIDQKKDLKLIDWEMAGNYPIGYDLFTFIFQTSFILHPKKSIKIIVEENKIWINKFFESFQLSNSKIQLKAFAEIKMVQEREKDKNSMLFKKYELLNNTINSIQL